MATAGSKLLVTDLTNWTSYTPTWTASTTNPTIGNGVITGSFQRIGQTVICRGRITMGSTTTFGSGSWRVSVPVTATASAIAEAAGSLWMIDSGTATRVGVCAFVDSTKLWLVGTSGDITPTSPHTWAVNDELRWSIAYQTS